MTLGINEKNLFNNTKKRKSKEKTIFSARKTYPDMNLEVKQKPRIENTSVNSLSSPSRNMYDCITKPKQNSITRDALRHSITIAESFGETP